MSDTIQTIRRSAKHFFSGTLLSRIAGMLRDMSMAYAFGTSPSIAAFMLAFRFAHLLRRLFGEGALQSAFIPEFERLRHQNTSQAFVFFRNLSVLLFLFLTLLIFIGSLTIGGFLLWGNLSPGNHEILFLTLLMLPSLLFICLYGFNASLLQCEKKFFTPSVAPVAFNLVWILATLGLKKWGISDERAMPFLSISVIFACFCQWLLTAPALLSILNAKLDQSLSQNIQLYSPDIKKLLKPLFLGMIGVAAFQINNAVDAIFARYADPEGPALLWYAMRLQQLPLALFGVAISGAILPPLSRAIKALDWSGYHQFLHYALEQTITLIIPLTAAIFLMGDSCANLLYGRGLFTDQSLLGTTRCLWAYAIGLLPSCLILILAPACYAQNDYRLPTIASCLTMLVNGCLNALLIIQFGLGAISVAFATSVSGWINLIFLSIALSKKNGSIFSSRLVAHSSKIIFITALASIGTLAIKTTQAEPSFFQLLTDPFIPFQKNFGRQSFYFLSQSLCFLGLWTLTFFSWRRFSLLIKNS